MNPMMSQIQDPMQGLQPMAEPEGFGVYGQSLEGYAEGGEAVPRQTMIADQPHMLAYINPEEEMMLQDYRQAAPTVPGPGGIPSYYYGQGMDSTAGNKTFEVSKPQKQTSNNNNDAKERRQEAARQAANLAKLQAQAAAAEKMVADQAAQQLAAETLAAQQSPMPDNNITASLNGAITPEDLANLDNKVASVDPVLQQTLDYFQDNIGVGTGFVNPEVNIFGEAGRGTGYVDSTAKTSLVPKSRIADLTDNSKTSGIMSVFNDVKSGIKNFIEDVGMTYAGGIGSFSDLSDQANYDKQYKKLVDEGYAPNNVADYLDTTRAGQTAIRKKTLDIKKTISPEERAVMKDERLADEARLASLAVGTGIDTIPIPVDPVPLPITGAGTVGANYNVMPESQYDYGYDETLYKGGASGPVEQQIVEQTMPEVGSPNAVVPTQVPAATVDPMTPVGGNFLLPGQQNYGPTPAAALNFNPNTYMQTPQNANVALSAMFQGSNPYTFEELLSQYKPAYSSFG